MNRRNSGQTGPKAASQAGRVLADPTSTKPEKAAAASALSQAPNSTGQTGKKAASQAAQVLADPTSTKREKTAAATALAQTPKRSNRK